MAKKKEPQTIEEKLQNALVPDWEQPYKLPENWCWTRLDSVLTEIKNGTTIKQDKSAKGFNVTRIESLQKQTIDLNRLGVIVDTDKIKDNDWYKANDIALSHINSEEHVGKTAIITEAMLPLVHGMNLLRLRFYNLVEPVYFQYYTQSFRYKLSVIERINRAVNQVSLNQKNLGSIEFPLPPLAEQKRIVDRIESLFAKLDEAKELAQNALDSFENRKSAILHKAFTGELTKKWREENGVSFDSWEEVSLNEIGNLERGKSKHRPRNDERLFGGEYPFVQTGDIARADTYVIEHKQTLSEFGLAQSKLFSKGTLCITIAANIGDVAILSYDCCFPDSVVAFTPNEKSLSKFIYYKMLILKDDIEANAPATAQKNINLKILGELLFPAPTLPEQQEIVRILDSIFAKETEAKELVSVIDKIDLIKKSILSKAFRGELGTNDMNEESSMGLLREILEGK